jgi:hypothetical protein
VYFNSICLFIKILNCTCLIPYLSLAQISAKSYTLIVLP